MTTYDFVFGIGRACACSQMLRRAGLQLLSLPFDWVTSDEPDLPERVAALREGFAGWLEESDLEFGKPNPANGMDVYRNRKTGFVMPHDFPGGVPLAESYAAVRAKYDRRIARFLKLAGGCRGRMLAVYLDPPGVAGSGEADCREAWREIREIYPAARVDFLMVALERGRRFEERTVEDDGTGFTRIAFDFRDLEPGKPDYAVRADLLAAALREVAAVGEYRTREEIAEFRETTRRKKMAAAGAKNAWEYFWIRSRRKLLHWRLGHSPRIRLAERRRRTFDHVLSLGSSCEPAFRYSLDWQAVDSTPFSWAASKSVTGLAEVIARPGLIGSEGFEWNGNTRMWRCRKTLISFHGRMKVLPGETPAAEALASDLEELVGRLGHLEEKLTRVLADDSSKALVYRIRTEHALMADVNGQLDALERALAARGANNCLLVVVAERKAKGRIAEKPGRVVRYVRAFNPGARVTDAELGDPVGWRALYAEFAPVRVREKRGRFKFEA